MLARIAKHTGLDPVGLSPAVMDTTVLLVGRTDYAYRM